MLGVHHYSLLISSFEFGCIGIGVWLYALRCWCCWLRARAQCYRQFLPAIDIFSPNFFPPFRQTFPATMHAIIVNHSSTMTMAAAGAGAAYHHNVVATTSD